MQDQAEGDAELIETVRGMLSADSDTADLLDEGIDDLAHLALDLESVGVAGLASGDQVGDFEIISELGRGGMGIVYAARDRKLGRVAALKLLPARTTLDSAARERLTAEAQAASALDHPNVATIYQIGETQGGHPFIAMARYEGETLRERILRGPIKPREAFGIARQVASGLAAAHDAGLVHRDVKPENIFLTRQGLVKLLDFGIATLAGSPREGPTTRGTVLYMSPEHARRQPADSRSDVWSLGVVLYEMLAGAPPYSGDTAAEILDRIADPAPVKPPAVSRRIPAAAAAVLARALEKDPNKRFADASQFAAQLERAERMWSRPRRLQIGVAAAAAVAIVAGFIARSGDDRTNTTAKAELAVLPVAGDTADHEMTDIASALRDEIAARVVGLGGVRLVQVRNDSAVRAQNRPGLHLLRMAIQRDGAAPTVSFVLERAGNDRSVWTERRAFDRRELRELGRDVVIGLLQAMGRPLTERERSMIGNGFPSNARAFEEFLLGNRSLQLRTQPGVERAIDHYRRASQLDPAFAAAHARQSYAYSLIVEWGWKPSRHLPADLISEGLALADRATHLDSTSADAWLARAYILVQRDPHRFAGAVEAFQYAIALDPYNAEAFHQYGQTLTALGRYAESLAAYRRALDLEPDRAMALVPMAAIHKRMGRNAEGMRLLDSAVAAAPKVPYARAARSMTRAMAGNLKGAREDAEIALTLDSTYQIPPLAALIRALWLAGDTTAALVRLAEVERAIVNPAAPSPTEAYWVGMAAASTGRFDRATALLRKARPRGAWLWFYFQGPELNELRRIPDAAAVLTEADPRRPRP